MVIGAVLAQNAHKNGIWKGFEKMARTIFSNRRDDFFIWSRRFFKMVPTNF